MKVVFILPSTQRGGIQNFVATLADELHTKQIQTEIIAVLPGANAHSRFDDSKIPVHSCPWLWSYMLPRADHLFGRYLRRTAQLTFAGRLRRLLTQIAPDVVNSHFHADGWGSQLRAVRGLDHVPYVLTLHSINTVYLHSPGRCRSFIRQLRPFDRLVADSDSLLEAYRQPLADALGQAMTIHLGQPPATPGRGSQRAATRRALDIPDDAFVLGSIGRLIPMKRNADVLQAVARLQADGVPVTFVCAGSGGEAAALAALAKNLGIADHVRFPGFVDNVEPLLDAVDTLILASEYEGFPVALLEAMAHGVPIIATNVMGTRELIANEQTGLLVPCGDVAGIAAAIRRFTGDRQAARQLAARALADFNARFSIRQCAADYLALFEQTITCAKPRTS